MANGDTGAAGREDSLDAETEGLLLTIDSSASATCVTIAAPPMNTNRW